MRLARFNILHGRTLHDGVVDLDRLADAIRFAGPRTAAEPVILMGDLNMADSRPAQVTGYRTQARHFTSRSTNPIASSTTS